MLFTVLLSALLLEEGLTTSYEPPCPRHRTLPLSSHLFVTDLKTLVVCLESFNISSFTIVPRNISGTDRVPEAFSNFCFKHGAMDEIHTVSDSKCDVQYHRQNPVDLHCEIYSLAVSIVNIRCYHGNLRSTCIRFASVYVPVLFSSCSYVFRLTRM